MRSIETSEGDRCVDIFRRGDGSFGFEGYRRDAEDTNGWSQVTHFGEQRYDTEAAAISAARRMFPWLR